MACPDRGALDLHQGRPWRPRRSLIGKGEGRPTAGAQMTDVSVLPGAAYDATPRSHDHRTVPHYLSAHYWWAYVHPNAVKVFERQWLVNLILWGNYRRLCDAALTELSTDLTGDTLQV